MYVLHSLTLKAVQIVNESEKLFISSEPLQVLFWANTMFNENDNKAKTSKKLLDLPIFDVSDKNLSHYEDMLKN